MNTPGEARSITENIVDTRSDIVFVSVETLCGLVC